MLKSNGEKQGMPIYINQQIVQKGLPHGIVTNYTEYQAITHLFIAIYLTAKYILVTKQPKEMHMYIILLDSVFCN